MPWQVAGCANLPRGTWLRVLCRPRPAGPRVRGGRTRTAVGLGGVGLSIKFMRSVVNAPAAA
eukprot:3780089-Rhodomonas_salina.2